MPVHKITLISTSSFCCVIQVSDMRGDFMGEETALVQSALDRFNAGDPQARNDLFARAAQRLQRIARRMLHGSFERVAALEQTGDVTQEASLRLLKALADVKIVTPPEFFRLSSAVMRRVLIDLARHHYGPEGSAAHRATAPADTTTAGTPAPTASSSNAPDKLAVWREFHERVDKLPDEQREVFDLLWYQELSQEEAAGVLGMSVPTVKRRWRDAKMELIDVLGDNFPGLD
jgi:RNA polymerase sigma factor (sigma-70 family)